MDAEELYYAKNEFLRERCDPVTPDSFYRSIFPRGELERAGHPEDHRPNMITLSQRGKRHWKRIVTDELDLSGVIDQDGIDWVITSPISYSGRSRCGANARLLYAMAFDLDGVGMDQLRDLLYQMDHKATPRASFIVCSGHNLHVYYNLKSPVPLNPDNIRWLNELKVWLTHEIWNYYTSSQKKIEIQPILQGFRMVGSASKLGEEFPVTAYRFGPSVDLDYMMEAVQPDDWRKEITTIMERKTTPMTRAKMIWPAWYEKRIVQGHPRGQWTASRRVYDWWLREISKKTEAGHRYFAIMCLAIYAVKCGISKSELRKDAMELLPRFDALSDAQHGHFTGADINAALKCYDPDYVTFPKESISRLCAIPIPTNKRNGRKQIDHMRRISTLRDFDYPNGSWRNMNGRPTAQCTVNAWRAAHPDGRKSECKADTGLSYPTIRKWWGDE